MTKTATAFCLTTERHTAVCNSFPFTASTAIILKMRYCLRTRNYTKRSKNKNSNSKKEKRKYEENESNLPYRYRPRLRQYENGKLLLSHGRCEKRYRSQKAGIKEVPALIVSLDRDAAAIVLVDSNLHREHILPSEKAFAYKMKADAMAHQGWRSDLTSGQVVPKSDDKRTTAIIGEDMGDSYKTVQRYIRLTNLIPEILEYVDEGRISFTPAVELSYLNEQEQYDLLEQMEINDCTPSLSQACRFKKISFEQGLTPEVIAEIMSEKKANQREMFKVPMERIRKYIPKGNAKQTEDFVLKACEHYYKVLQRKKEHCL